MPIYEYQCQSCHHQLEALQKVSDSPLTDCPACGKPDLRKMVSAAAFRLKGGGWYETDFKTSSKKNLAGDQATSGGDSTSGAGDSKPAAKPESSSPGSDKGGNAKNTTTG
ncbi:MAG: zinc ribbon domain-containing protein [Halieaceae bacterium]|jgi:putative FmdB family regulatory protein|nr:zinc ribbon domain-containing protein [Halieaceae bacterium]